MRICAPESRKSLTECCNFSYTIHMSAFSRELRSFVVVSQSASIRAAADRLNLSAPALSRQLKMLENSYGTQLLVRSATGIALTGNGEALRDEAVRWLAEDASFLRRIQQNEQDFALRLRLGVMGALVADFIPRLSKRLETSFGEVELELAVGTTNEIVNRAEALELDIIVAFNTPRIARLIVVHRQEYHVGAVHAPGFAVSPDGPLALSEALQHPLCILSADLSGHTQLLAEMLSVRVNPRVCISSNSISALLDALKAGRGIGFLTWPDVSHEVEAGRLVFRPLDKSRLTESLDISICHGNALGSATGKVVEQITEVLKEIGT